MAIFELTSPDGKKYEVNAPDGATPDQVYQYFQSNQPQESAAPKNTLMDSVKKYGRLAVDQGLQGVPLVGTFTDEATDALGALGAGALLGENPIDLYQSGRESTQGRIDQQQTDNPLASLAAQLAGGIGVGGAVASGTKIGGTINNVLRSGSTASRIGKGVATGAGAGALYGSGAANDGEMLPGAAEGALLGGVTGGAIPAIGGAYSGVKNALTPAIDEARAPVANLAKKHGIRMGLDDLTDSEFYKRLIQQGESLPGSGGLKKADAQQVDLNKAVTRTIGQEASRVTPEYLKSQRDRLGTVFQDLTKGKNFDVTPEYYTAVDEIKNKASRGGYGAEGANFLDANLKRISDIIDDNGLIKGDRLDKLRREFAKDARERYDDIGRLSDDLESAVVEIITAGDPKVAKTLSDAKYQYKNLKTIQSEAIKDQVSGNLRPATLMNAVRRKFGDDAVAIGEAGDLGEIARVAQSMRKLNDSGTAKNQVANSILTGNALGLIPTAAFGGPLAALGQLGLTGAGLAGNRLLQNRNVNEDVVGGALQKLGAPQTPLKLTVRPSDKNILNKTKETLGAK